MPEPQHFSDYGFDPQIDYFQKKILEEAHKHKRDSFKSMDALHFKLQKQDSKKSKKKKKKRWWRNALLFWKWKWTDNARPNDGQDSVYRRNRVCREAVSGPLYITETIRSSTTPCQTSCHLTSGPLA